MIHPRCASLVLALGLALLTAAPAAASTYAVGSTDDTASPNAANCPADTAASPTCRLRDAVLAANGHGGADTIAVPAGTYTLTSSYLNITDAVTIDGADRATTIIDGNGAHKLFDSDPDLTLNHLTLQHGFGSGGAASVLDGNGTFTLSDCVVRDNSTTGIDNVGAIKTQNLAPSLTVPNCVFSGNTITTSGIAEGAAITTDPGTTNVTITGSTFTDNTATAGAGQGSLGGAVFLGGGGTVTGSTFTGNSAVATAGGNTSAGGGAIYMGGNGAITDSVLTDNTAQMAGNHTNAALGGGVIVASGTVSLTGLTVSGNSAIAAGGIGAGGAGVYIVGGTTTFAGNTVSGNTVTATGVGTIGFGGGIGASTGGLTITNSTISGNSVSSDASTSTGGGYGTANASGTSVIQNTTVADNSTAGATPSGGNLDRTAAITLTNSIVSGGKAGGAAQNCPATGAAVTGSHTIDDDGTCVSGGTNQNADPKIGALLDNGGPTKTRAPIAGSPAIDNGDTCAATDQRGISRPQGLQCDIGAVEVVQDSDLGVSQTGSATSAAAGDTITFTITVSSIGTIGADATQPTVTDQLPAGAELVGATPSQGSCNGTTTVTCALGTLANGSNATITVSARLNQAGANVNTASVASPRPDPNPADDSSAFTVQLPAPVASGGGGSPGGGSPGGGGGPPPPTRDTTAPVFTLRLSPSAFAKTARVSYSLSEAATVTFTVERATVGRKVGRSCVKATRVNRKRPRCTRFVRVAGSLKKAGKAGANTFKFSARFNKRKLPAGKYRLVAVATDAAGNKSAPKRASFRVKRR